MTAIDWVLSAACVWLAYRLYRVESQLQQLVQALDITLGTLLSGTGKRAKSDEPLP
jgi:hypothetical protein